MGVANDVGSVGATFVGAMSFIVFGAGAYFITTQFGNDIVDAVRGRLRV